MLLIVSDDGKLEPGAPRDITLTISELLQIAKISGNNYFSIESVIRKIVLRYVSQINQKLDIPFYPTTPTTTVTLPEGFVGDMRIQSVALYDYSGGHFIVERPDLPVVELDIDSNIEDAPSSLIQVDSSSQVLNLPLGEGVLWKTGWVVRIWDPTYQTYSPISGVIANITDDVITLQQPIATSQDLVLQSPDGSKYNVTIDADGVLTTELYPVGTQITEEFIILKEKVLPLDPNEYAQIKVRNDGTLFVDYDPDTELPVNMNYPLKDPSGFIWYTKITPNDEIFMDSDAALPEGKYLRFGFSDEVTVEQLTQYRYGY